MDLSSSRILTTSSIANTSSGAIIIPAVKGASSLNKNSLNPMRIGDAALQKMRTITTTAPTTSSNDTSDQQPAVFIMNNTKTEPQQPRTITVNRLLFSNNANNQNTSTPTTIINGQNGISLATLVNNLHTLSQMSLLQSPNNTTMPTATHNSIAKLLETPILSTSNVVQTPQATMVSSAANKSISSSANKENENTPVSSTR
ncbi:unnamed protein product, partial [Rotaria magnacalcarata]